MIVTLRPNGPRTLDWMRAFVEGSEAVDPRFHGARPGRQSAGGLRGGRYRGSVYEFVCRMLVRLDYGRTSSGGGRQTLSRQRRGRAEN